MTSETFVKIGDRVTVYQDPYTMKKPEGKGRIIDVHDLSDMESAYVDVWFDDDDDGDEKYSRWVLPSHVDKS